MKKQFQIRYNYSAHATTIDITLTPFFKALMAETFAICLAYSHAEKNLKDSSSGLEVLQRLAFDHATKSINQAREMNEALVLACRAALFYASKGRANDNLARVIVMLARATPCAIAKIELPARCEMKGAKDLSKIATAAYEILRQKGSRSLEIPVFTAFQLSSELSEIKRLPRAVQCLLDALESEIQLFILAMTCLGMCSEESDRSEALAAALRN